MCGRKVEAISKYKYIATEDCFLIRVDWENFKETLLNPLKDEFLRKIRALKNCQFIKQADPFCAVVLALLGNISTYGYGEVILKQGNT